MGCLRTVFSRRAGDADKDGFRSSACRASGLASEELLSKPGLCVEQGDATEKVERVFLLVQERHSVSQVFIFKTLLAEFTIERAS